MQSICTQMSKQLGDILKLFTDASNSTIPIEDRKKNCAKITGKISECSKILFSWEFSEYRFLNSMEDVLGNDINTKESTAINEYKEALIKILQQGIESESIDKTRYRRRLDNMFMRFITRHFSEHGVNRAEYTFSILKDFEINIDLDTASENLEKKLKDSNLILPSLKIKGIYTDDKIKDNHIQTICEIIRSNNTSITSIDLANNFIGVEGAEAIAKALESNTSITSIDLANNFIGDAGAEAIANTSLTSISLVGNNIGDAGAKAIATALESNTSLTHINLWNNHIRYAGAEAIAKTLKVNTSITSIILSRNVLNDTEIKKINKIINGYKKNINLRV